jgi:DUF4097 and DUF4098 domain-containing protein YvlB
MPHARLVGFLSRAALACAAVFSLTACDVVVNTMEGGRSTATDLWAKTYTLQDGAQIAVVNTNGHIDVEGVDGTTLDVKAEITARAGTDEAARELLKQVEIREEAGTARIRLETRYPKGLGRSSVSVKYTLRVPRSAKVEVETVNGGIRVADVSGAVRAETTNGGVKASGVKGALTATSTNGGIDVQVLAVTSEGVSLETTNGAINLRLPGEAKGTISARCVNGGISVSDLDVAKTESSRRRLEGTLNGGGPAIRLETVNGGIKVHRSQG